MSQHLTLGDIRALYQRYVPHASQHPGARGTGSPRWWPAHEIGHLLTVPHRNIGMSMFGLDNEGASYQETERFLAYELAAMSISRRLLTACGRPDLFYDPKIGELEASDYDVVHFGSRSYARRLLRQRRLLRLPRTRAGLEVLCQRALAGDLYEKTSRRSVPRKPEPTRSSMTRTKYILPDGRPIIAITSPSAEPQPMITFEVSPGDALWSQGQRIPGTQRRFVLAEMALGL